MNLKPFASPTFLDENPEDLYENAPCGYLSILADGTILKINQTLLNWLGYERHELLGRIRFQELLNIGGRIFYETHFAPLLKMQGFLNEVAFDLVQKNKKQLPVLTTVTQRKDSSGLTTVNRITVFNITDRKKYERELLLERQKAEQAARAKADFLSMMSHEIRTPMNAVIGIVNLLEGTELSVQQREYTHMLKSSSESLLALLNSILDFSKIESGKINIEERNFNLKSLIIETVRSLQSKAREKNLMLKIHQSPEIPDYIVGDPVKLRQILTNLIGNAVKFTDVGFISVNAICKSVTNDIVQLHFEVVDTGIGIPADRLPRIFDEFTQVDYETGLKYGGTGLGLTISQKLVELFGSKIKVESEIGKGSKFCFDLQMKVGEKVLEKQFLGSSAIDTRQLAGLRVLIAEDNKDNAYIVSRLLKSWHVDIEVAVNGKEVLEKVHASSFDLVLMDLRMPVIDGYQATQSIRAMSDKKRSAIPIIAFSASTRIGEADLVEFTAFDDVIGKPFRPEELYSKIAALTGRAIELAGNQKNEELPETKVLNIAKPGMEDKNLTLSVYMEALDGDKVALRDILNLVIDSYKDAKENFQVALQSRNLDEFEFQVHRIKSSMEMLRARSLRQSIEDCRTVLKSNMAVEPVSNALTKQLDKTIAQLSSAVASDFEVLF